MAKKFTDPYEKCKPFKSVLDSLTEIGFFKPHCEFREDVIFKAISFSDGSNALIQKVIQAPVGLYDALEDELYGVKLEINSDLVWPLHGYGAKTISLDEMRERVWKKEFRDEFR